MVERVRVLAYFAAGYPHDKINRQTLAVYAHALDDCDAEKLKETMMKLIRTKTHFPSVAEIRQAMSDARIPHKLAGKPQG